MSRLKKLKQGKTRRRGMDPEVAIRIRRVVVQGVLLVLFLGVCAGAYVYAGRFVEREVAFVSQPPRVVLVNRPHWMSDYLAEQIEKAARPLVARSALDHELLVASVEMLQASPWIREVWQVRRVYGERPGDTIEVDCDYRAPIAAVKWGKGEEAGYWLVDGQGYKLPERFSAGELEQIVQGRNGRTNIRIVEGVQVPPPPRAGMRWNGNDLIAGLELIELLLADGRAFTDEILAVDVSNFLGRENPREPQLVLHTSQDTRIRWGRPVNAADFFVEVGPAQKLERLDQVRADYGRIDAGHPWIDIRFDIITHANSTGFRD